MILDFNYLLKNSRHLYIYLLSWVRETGQVTERTFSPFYNWKNHWDQIPASGVLWKSTADTELRWRKPW